MATRALPPLPAVLNKMVYVTPADDYKASSTLTHSNNLDHNVRPVSPQALDYTQVVFPELAEVCREDISFSVMVQGKGEKTSSVLIRLMAWSSVMATLPQYHYVAINVHSSLNVPEDPDLLPPHTHVT